MKRRKKMSLERGSANCMRCYGIYELIREEKSEVHAIERGRPEAIQRVVLRNDRLYAAKNEAMRGVEDAIERAIMVKEMCGGNDANAQSIIDCGRKSLRKCMEGDCEESYIANLNEDNIKLQDF